MSPKIAIIGAGMNGLALALSLRLFGLEATIYEQADKPRADGTGICIWPEGMQILAALTSKEEISHVCNFGNTFETLTASGQMINKMGLQSSLLNNVAPLGQVARPQIYHLLLEKLGAKNIITNKKCIKVEGHKIYFSDDSCASADIIIGADGMFSKVRQTIFPDSLLKTSGVKAFRGLTPFKTDLICDDSVYVFSGEHSRIVTYTTDRKTQQKYWFAARKIQHAETYNSKEDILHHFSDYAPELLEMIAQTPEENMIESELFELQPMTSWFKDNVVLVGDSCCAALPSMAIGFSLGLENAFVLAQCLATNFYDIDAAFKRYQARCLPRSNKLMQITADLNEMVYDTHIQADKVAALYQDFFTTIGQSPF